MASGSLTYLMGRGVASNNSDQVGYLKKRVMLTEAAGDAELVLCDRGEFGYSLNANAPCKLVVPC